ncbi:carboxypeptidase regulatory-like domain-containing protein [Arthrobacter nitrophenolicus]|uniref:Carboxypeptidase regulatory-like domain-containing protein n=1 Tax=Arthrobacter nitrophenolicus TaxID=683150 RepID=A0A4R5Y983_9MICC|nr:carboxypeptidase regulatory-like domain-containing protein [Arthrobacter nitrophenolicus]TDL39682.1 carboxypeptidase regulatory-like domain-containing protein [Arthrobacter nitrophenolicus]
MISGPEDVTMAVWGANGPIEIGANLTVRVGALSRRGESLVGRTVRVVESGGKEVARGALGEEAWPGTALLWTTIVVPVPSEPGLHSWEAHVDASTLAFSIAAVPVPAHALRVLMINTTNLENTPLPGVHVRAGHYAATTDETGRAELSVPKGTHTLHAWKQGYGRVATTMEVHADVEISLATEVLADKDPQYVREHWL